MNQLRQCGIRGTFTMKDGSVLEQETAVKAVKANQLEFDSFEKVVRQRAQRELSFSLAKPPS